MALCALAIILLPAARRAQEFRGTISDSVTDTSEAAVSVATIAVTEVHTGTVSRTVSDASG